MTRANFAVFASGNGGNLQSIIKAVQTKKIKANLVLVFSDRAEAFALTRAQKSKIPTAHINPKDFSSREEFDLALMKVLKSLKVDFIVLAGYMRLLSRAFIQQYPKRIINIHPSLLPSFKGVHGIRDAFEYGVKVTGVSVHYVSEAMDAGEIIAQVPVVISAKDTLESLEIKIHKAEHALYPQVIAKLIR